MQPEAPTDLDYELLDDVLPGVTSATRALRDELLGCRAVAIGPLVEYAFQAAVSRGVLPSLREVAPSELTSSLEHALTRRWSTQADKTTSMHSRSYEFSRVPDSKLD